MLPFLGLKQIPAHLQFLISGGLGMYLPLHLCVRRYRHIIAISCAVWFLILATGVTGFSQESYLVTAADASLNVYDLSTNNHD